MKLLTRTALALAVLAVGAAPAAAKPNATANPVPVAPGTRYLALGDSVTFGYMESNVVPAPNYHNAANFFGYPELAGDALHLKVANAACSGETSSSLINPKAQSNGCENSPGHPGVGYRTQFPLHVKYKGSQLAFALSYLKAHKNVSLVSLMIGANDFFVCQETAADGCATTAEQNAVAANVTSNIHTILGSIRKKAHFKGQIAIVNYYSLNYAVPAVNAQSQLLNKVQDAAAKPYHVVIADGYGELQKGAAHFGGGTCQAGLITELNNTPGTCGIHPSYAGQSLLALALEKAIKL
ncbi:MAG: SGNH/GDSL hydrolase family protein [Solirubrobacteraceae bacterium]